MIRIRKRMILSELKNLRKMNEQLKNLKSKAIGSANAEKILIDCQNKAIRLGNAIEEAAENKSIETELAETVVPILEKYCEFIYQLSQHGAGNAEYQKICREIQKALLHAENEILHHMPEDKKEIVFLPYKASMWDSLESVWMAAREDENYEVYVVPVPYFEKLPDGTLGAMHYEGNDYPDIVPITHWQEYDIAARHPEMVFIHNPYDSGNRITSVHPMFYAKELKNYTDQLIYIPYFVGVNGKVKEDLCLTAGVLYAHKVIVESEKVKENYINVIRSFEREKKSVGVFGNLDKKILALGSPKIDRIKYMQKYSSEFPPEWMKKIQKADGTKKKLILYNTSIASLLEYKENAIKKISHVIQIFKNQSEAVLIWRPHPLYRNTIETMLPRMLENYEQMVAEYREKEYGIYDDSADIERAIALSDAYYGDYSSVVTLYQVTGKPIMIQNYNLGI